MEIKIKELDVDLIAPSRKTFMNADQGGSKIVIIGKPGCFSAETALLIWDSEEREMVGSIQVTDIEVGDYLVGPELESQRVIALCQGWEEMYSICYLLSDEKVNTVQVNRHHMLTLWNKKLQRVEDIPLTAFLNGHYRVEDFDWMLIEHDIHDIHENHDNNDNDNTGGTGGTGRTVKNIKKVCWYYEEKDEGMYYGFELEGESAQQHRCLLADGSIVHNTGKTTLITSLLYEKSSIFPIGLVMSGTEDSNGHYRRIFPSSFVYNSLREKKIEDFITRQKVAKMHVPNPWSILLLDDCTDDPKILNKPLFQGLYKNGRHWKMLYILSLQYCMDVKPVVRTNIDGTFILRESSLRNRKVLWENYASIIPDFSTFCAIMDSATSDYTALYIHNATQSNKIEDCVFWYRAKPVPSGFKFGSPDFWKFDKQRFDPDYKDSYSY